VDDPERMSLLERAEQPVHDLDGLRDGQRPALLDQLGNRLALDKLHDQVRRCGGITARVEDAGNGRCLETASQLDLALEASHDAGDAGDVRVQHFDGDSAPAAQVTGTIDIGVAATADKLGQLVGAVENLTDHAPASADPGERNSSTGKGEGSRGERGFSPLDPSPSVRATSG
jgi:hypothetical protein